MFLKKLKPRIQGGALILTYALRHHHPDFVPDILSGVTKSRILDFSISKFEMKNRDNFS